MTLLVDGELVLYGFVGDNFWGDGFTAREVIDALAEHGRSKDITVRINSGGGYVDDGIAIFNALLAHKGKVTVVVDAMAASSASIIAMAGTDRVMRQGSTLMIHDPSSVVWGTAEDMAKAIKALEKQAENLAGIYSDVTGETIEAIRADMKAETWLSADEAVTRGFATSANDNDAKAAAAFDYRVYAHAPDRLVASAKSLNWSHHAANRKAAATASAEPARTKEPKPMTEKTTETTTADPTVVANTIAGAKQRIQAIMANEEAKTRPELAAYFAFDTEMPAEDVIKALAKAPKGAKESDEQNYETERQTATNLARPTAKTSSEDALAPLAAAVNRVNKRR